MESLGHRKEGSVVAVRSSPRNTSWSVREVLKAKPERLSVFPLAMFNVPAKKVAGGSGSGSRTNAFAPQSAIPYSDNSNKML